MPLPLCLELHHQSASLCPRLTVNQRSQIVASTHTFLPSFPPSHVSPARARFVFSGGLQEDVGETCGKGVEPRDGQACVSTAGPAVLPWRPTPWHARYPRPRPTPPTSPHPLTPTGPRGYGLLPRDRCIVCLAIRAEQLFPPRASHVRHLGVWRCARVT
jgi:hypothetical protein